MASSSAGPETARSSLIELCRVGRNLTKHDEKLLYQWVEVLKHHLKSKCYALVKEAAGEAVLYSYSADATPLRCSKTAVHPGESGAVVRKGRALEEILLQRGCLTQSDVWRMREYSGLLTWSCRRW